jgi:SAM-dependent methyltransferase
MQFDAPALADFYESPMGQVARRHILRRIRLIWPTLANRRVLGYGFAVPYLRSFIGEAERVVAVMPAHQGAVAWPAVRQLVTLADEDALPFPDAFFDCLLVVHGLETTDAMKHFLRQLWRVLAPEGKLLQALHPNAARPPAQGRDVRARTLGHLAAAAAAQEPAADPHRRRLGQVWAQHLARIRRRAHRRSAEVGVQRHAGRSRAFDGDDIRTGVTRASFA